MRKAGIARILALGAFAAALVIPCVSRAGDVFSDAKSWHKGFVDVNGDGIMNVGKTEFPESLLIAEPNNDAHNVTKLPILAMGGIYEAKDAIEFFLAGATAVAVGTATFTDPGVVA